MNCRQAYRFICDNLDGSVASARCRAIRKHITHCPRCRAYLDSLKETIQLYRRTSGPKLPRTAHRELMKALDTEMLGRPEHPRKSVRRN